MIEWKNLSEEGREKLLQLAEALVDMEIEPCEIGYDKYDEITVCPFAPSFNTNALSEIVKKYAKRNDLRVGIIKYLKAPSSNKASKAFEDIPLCRNIDLSIWYGKYYEIHLKDDNDEEIGPMWARNHLYLLMRAYDGNQKKGVYYVSIEDRSKEEKNPIGYAIFPNNPLLRTSPKDTIENSELLAILQPNIEKKEQSLKTTGMTIITSEEYLQEPVPKPSPIKKVPRLTP